MVNGGGNVNFTNVRSLRHPAHARSPFTQCRCLQNIVIDDATTDFDICVGAELTWAGCNCSQPNLYEVPLSARCLNGCAHQGLCEGNGGTPGQNTRDYVPGAPWGAVSLVAYNTTRWNTFNFGPVGKPGSRLERNIFVMAKPKAQVIGGNLYEVHNGKVYDSTRLTSSDRNLLYSPSGASDFHFPAFHTLDSWRNLSHDVHSRVGDPLFADVARGNYTLKPGSPAFALGFVQIPPIRAPFPLDDATLSNHGPGAAPSRGIRSLQDIHWECDGCGKSCSPDPDEATRTRGDTQCSDLVCPGSYWKQTISGRCVCTHEQPNTCTCECVKDGMTKGVPTGPCAGMADDIVAMEGISGRVGQDFIPQCDEQGNYMPVQCDWRTAECWCVDDAGDETAGSRVSLSNVSCLCPLPAVFLRYQLRDNLIRGARWRSKLAGVPPGARSAPAASQATVATISTRT